MVHVILPVGGYQGSAKLILLTIQIKENDFHTVVPNT